MIIYSGDIGEIHSQATVCSREKLFGRSAKRLGVLKSSLLGILRHMALMKRFALMRGLVSAVKQQRACMSSLPEPIREPQVKYSKVDLCYFQCALRARKEFRDIPELALLEIIF